jgi:hypothetical protein
MEAITPSRNLVVVHTPDSQALSDWETVAAKIAETAPDIDVRIASNTEIDPEISRWQTTRPSLVVSPVPFIRYAPAGGRVYVGRALNKLEQVERLTAAGIPIPHAVALLPYMPLKREAWGDFVIVKPQAGSRGDFVRLVRTEEVGPRYLELTNNQVTPMMVQAFVDHTNPDGRLLQYRVLMFLGRPLYAVWYRARQKRRPLAKIADDRSARIAANARGAAARDWDMAYEDEVFDLARAVGEAFREFPLLGVDIVRERSTGKLQVLETNSGGNVWHLSSRTGMDLGETGRHKLYSQLGALDVAAEALIEKTRAEAR